MAFAKNPTATPPEKPASAELDIDMDAASAFVGAGVPDDYREREQKSKQARRPRKSKGQRKGVLVRYPVEIYEDVRELAHIQRTTIQEIVQEATEMVLKRPKNKKLLAEYRREQQD